MLAQKQIHFAQSIRKISTLRWKRATSLIIHRLCHVPLILPLDPLQSLFSPFQRTDGGTTERREGLASNLSGRGLTNESKTNLGSFLIPRETLNCSWTIFSRDRGCLIWPENHRIKAKPGGFSNPSRQHCRSHLRHRAASITPRRDYRGFAAFSPPWHPPPSPRPPRVSELDGEKGALQKYLQISPPHHLCCLL